MNPFEWLALPRRGQEPVRMSRTATAWLDLARAEAALQDFDLSALPDEGNWQDMEALVEGQNKQDRARILCVVLGLLGLVETFPDPRITNVPWVGDHLPTYKKASPRKG